MPVSICPRCQHVNPEYASYCFYDGSALHANQNAVVLRLPSEFVFPSGRRCGTFDELAQGCQEEWTAARDLLMRGGFEQFFRAGGRADLVRAAADAKAQANPDISLTTFLNALPGMRTQTPKLDLNPRRILLGNLLVGETKTVPLTITNQAHGLLQGTVSVTEGQDWLTLSETGPVHEIEVSTVREQVVKLTINTKGIAAGQTYGARLTVVTNGGVVEVPLRMDLVAQPFTKAPFQGVRTQRDLADKMRHQAKAAVPILESGDVQRWFAHNGWTFPVRGTPIKGVGGVQQFFEGMGVSKPPPVHLSQTEFRFTCKYKETLRGQVTLQTDVKKWVYAEITSDRPWLKIVNRQVSGPQHATIPFEIDTHLWNHGSSGEGHMTLDANGGQKLTAKVIVEVQGAPGQGRPKPPPIPAVEPFDFSVPSRIPAASIAAGPPPVVPTAATAPIAAGPPPRMPAASLAEVPSSASSLKFVPALITTVLLCLVLRIALVPLVDMVGRSSVAAAAAKKVLDAEPAADSPFAKFGGWLQLPWLAILGGADTKFSASVFQPGNNGDISTLEFRHYFVSYFIRWFVLLTFWIGALVGVLLVLRRGGTTLDVPWAVIAGAVAGCGVSATLAAFILVVEMIPHTLWHLTLGGHGGGGYLVLWILLAIASWLLVGLGLGAAVPWIGPLRRLVIDPFQWLLAGVFRGVGMQSLADYWTP